MINNTLFHDIKPKINRYANKVGLFCNARDEKNMKEWAAHHLLLGFDCIIIFDHKSIEPLSNTFNNFDKKVSIIRIDYEMDNIKMHFMDKAIGISKQLNMDWFIYLDADEFLILNKVFGKSFSNVKHFLNTYSYGDEIGINWVMFGSNYFTKSPEGLLLENYNRSSLITDQHVKSFVRPHKIKRIGNPHYYMMKDMSKMIGLNFKNITPKYSFNDLKLPFYNSPAYIAHYVYQSEETYKKRKVDLKGDDGIQRSDMGKEIHNFYNEIINNQPQKYVAQIKSFLKYYENK